MRLSKLISVILHPIFMPLLMLKLSLFFVPHFSFAISDSLAFFNIIVVLSTIVFPLFITLILIQKNKVTSLEMSGLKERSLPLVCTAFSMFIGYLLLQNSLASSPILKKELLGAFAIIVVAAIVSKYWKISLHMLGIGGLVGVLLSLELLFGGLYKILVLFIFLSGFLGVARIKEKAHNHSQVFFGFAIGFLIEISSILLL